MSINTQTIDMGEVREGDEVTISMKGVAEYDGAASAGMVIAINHGNSHPARSIIAGRADDVVIERHTTTHHGFIKGQVVYLANEAGGYYRMNAKTGASAVVVGSSRGYLTVEWNRDELSGGQRDGNYDASRFSATDPLEAPGGFRIGQTVFLDSPGDRRPYSAQDGARATVVPSTGYNSHLLRVDWDRTDPRHGGQMNGPYDPEVFTATEPEPEEAVVQRGDIFRILPCGFKYLILDNGYAVLTGTEAGTYCAKSQDSLLATFGSAERLFRVGEEV